MGPADFIRWLDARGVLVTKQYLHQLINEGFTPGPKFKAIFREITGIQLVDGLIEKDRA
jgi:hypothetical protein